MSTKKDHKTYIDSEWLLSEYETTLRKEQEEAVADVEKAYGGCHFCYGKGYGTQTVAWEGRGHYEKLPTMKFCKCGRGKQLEDLLTPQNTRTDTH